MRNEFQPEENPITQMARSASPQTPLAEESEAEAQAACLVTERLNEITRRAKRAKRRSNIGSKAVYFFVMVAGCLAICLFASSRSAPYLIPIVMFSAIFGQVLLEFWGELWGVSKFDAEELAQLGGVKAVPALFAALENHLPKAQIQAIRAALTRLLPQMKASDAALLTPNARRAIHSWVRSSFYNAGIFSNTDALRFASLKALE